MATFTYDTTGLPDEIDVFDNTHWLASCVSVNQALTLIHGLERGARLSAAAADREADRRLEALELTSPLWTCPCQFCTGIRS